MRIRNISKETVLATQVVVANTFYSRMKGLLGRKSLDEGEALVITHCQSIHMLFMRFSIDALFIDQNDRVVGRVLSISPFQFSPIFWKASFVVELPAGCIERAKTSLRDVVRIED